MSAAEPGPTPHGETAIAGILPGDILSLERFPDESDSTVYVAGSLIEGFGNDWSDLDVFVITDREPAGPNVRRANTNLTTQHYVGRRRVDFEYWRPATVAALAQRLRAVEPGAGRHMVGSLFLPIELIFIHRLRTGRPLWRPDRFAAYQALFDFGHFRTFLTEETLRYLDALLDDVVGMNESSALRVALLRAREALDAAIDAYLHRLGNTDPTRKWRPVYLERYDDGSPRHRRFTETYWRLQFPAPPELGRAHVEACVRFANEVVAWIQA